MPAAQQRPLTDAEFRNLSQAQLRALGLLDDNQGAPSDFTGTVLPNPDHLRLYEDTESGIEPTRLPTGVKFLGDLAHGEMPRDVSNPAPAELVAPQMRTVGASMSAPAQVDYDAIAQQHGGAAALDYDALAQQHGGSASSENDDRSWLQRFTDNIHSAATEPIDRTLDSYSHATEFGAKHVRQGVAQAIEGTAHMIAHPITAAEEMGLVPTDDDPTGVKRILQMAHGLRDAIPKDLLDLAGKSGNLGGQILTGEAMGQTAGAGLRVAGKTAGVVSDVAQKAADRMTEAASKVTPKQAAQAAGAVGGAGLGKGVLSIPGAYYGGKTFGHVAEILLGKDRANAPIFTKAASLDEAADAVAEVIARDREAQTQAGALGKLPATAAKTAAQTGEALATGPVSTNLTPEAKATSSAPRFTLQDRVAAKSLLEDALKTHTGDVIDQVVPGKNAAVKSRVEFYLKKGDVAGAEAALDKGAKAWKNLDIDRQAQAQAAQELGSTSDPQFLNRSQELKEQMMSAAGTNKPAWTALDRQPVPSTNEIRARVQREAAAPKPGTRADLMEDKGIDQQWQWHLDRHGWAAESEARREFIARNSTGMTKGELAKRFAAGRSGSAAQTAAGPAGESGTAAAALPENDLISILEKSLDAVRKAQK